VTAPGMSVGTVWVDVLPSMKGFGAALGKEAATSSAAAGAVAGRGFSTAMLAGVAAIGVGVGAVGAVLLGVGRTFQEVTNTIRVGTGATGQALQALVGDAKAVGANVPADFKDVGVAVADLNTRLGLTGAPLQAAATQFLNLSRITGTDLQTNIASVTRVFGDWGIASGDQANALDAIYRASQATGVGIDSLSTNVVKFGAPLRQLGFSFEESLAMLGKFEKEGVNTELVMGSMRIALGKMARAGEEPIDTYRRVTEQIKNAGSAGEANALALDLFGAKAGPDMAAAIREGRFEIGELTDLIANGTETINDAAADTMSFTETWQIFKNRVLIALEPLATKLFKALGDAMGWFLAVGAPALAQLAATVSTVLGPALTTLGGFLASTVVPALMGFARFLYTARTPITVIAGVIATLFLPHLIALGVTATITAAKTAAAWVVMQVSAIRAAIVHSAQVVAMVAGWVLLGARALLHAGLMGLAWGIVGFEAAKAAAAHLLHVVRMVAGWVLLGVQSMIAAAKVAAAWLIAMGPIGLVIAAVVAVVALIIANWDTIKAATIAAWNAVVAAVRTAWEWIKQAFNTAVAFLRGVWTAFWGTVTSVATTVWNAVSGFIGSVWGAIRSAFSTAVAFLSALWTGYWNMVRAVATTIFNAVRAVIDVVWGAIRSAFTTATTFLSGLWTTYWNNLRTNATTIFNAIRAVIDVVWAAIRAAFNAATTFLRNLWASFWNTLRQVGETVFNAIRSTIGIVWSVIQNAFRTAVSTVQGVWQGFWNNLSSVASTVFNTIKRTIDTVINGIIGAFRFVVAQIGTIWNGIRRLLAAPVNFMIGTVFNNGIVRAWNFVAGLLPGVGPIRPIAGIPAFREGGPIPGRPDQPVPIMAHGNEHVWTDEEVRAVGGHRAVERLRQRALEHPVGLNTLNSGKVTEGADHEGPGVSSIGFGGVKPHVARAGHFLKRMFGIATVGGVGSRPGPSDHPRGLALDFMTYRDQAKGDRLVNYLLPRAGHFGVKYVIWKQRINSGSGWKGMADRGSVTANHFDHPHVSFRDGPGGASGFANTGGDSWFNPIPGMIRRFFETVTNPLLNRLPGEPPRFLNIPKEFARFARDKVLDHLLSAAGPEDGGGGGAGSGPVQEQVRAVAKRYGWGGGSEWAALDRLIQKESGWNPTAQNPRSTAYGLFQFLNSTWGTVGATKTSNPGLQAEAGLKYIQQRYRTPSGALAFHNRNNWYDNGGWMPPGFGAYFNGTGKPEAVLTNEQWKMLAERAQGGEGRSVVVNMEVHNPIAERASDTAARKLRTAAALGMFG
jgi:TP901 family phage tail tape measure protein